MAKAQTKTRKILGIASTIMLIVVTGLCAWYLIMYFTNGKKEPVISVPSLAPTVESPVDESDVTPEQKTEYKVPAQRIRYLSIPDLGIENSRVVSVGIYKGAIDSPANINDVAWYNASALPGSGGAILIDGHNGGVSKDGVFVNLGSLAVGATITLERGDGRIFHYNVVENRSASLDEVNNGGMGKMLQSAEPGREGLNLITCDGVYDKVSKQFNRRIMLKAVLKEQK